MGPLRPPRPGRMGLAGPDAPAPGPRGKAPPPVAGFRAPREPGVPGRRTASPGPIAGRFKFPAGSAGPVTQSGKRFPVAVNVSDAEPTAQELSVPAHAPNPPRPQVRLPAK